MTTGKASALVAGLVGAFALGVWTGPRVTSDHAKDISTPVAAIDASVHEFPAPAVPARTPPESVVARRATTSAPLRTGITAAAPELHSRLKPYLKSGADMDIAAAGFHSAEQFATVAHASQNVGVPFMLLKHRVLNEGDTLVAAIRKSKPDVNAVVEADRARAEARSDIASID